MSMITAAQWVPRGFAAPFPQKYQLDETEYERIAELAKLQLDDAEEDLKEAQGENGADDESAEDSDMKVDAENGNTVNLDDEDLKKYNLDDYDNDEEDDEQKGEATGLSMFGNIKSLAYYSTNEQDPYITLNEDEEAEDKNDLQILATDNLILSAKVEDELAHLEVYVYEDGNDNLYVHHDILLPAIPLAVEWLDMPVSNNGQVKGDKGNFVAIGTMDPDIEIWDLDTVDSMYPNAILGQGANPDGDKKSKKNKKKAKKMNDEYHVDAVLSLAANRQHRNLLASASADKTVKLWDLNTTKCAKSYSYHTDKVCSLAWHNTEATILLTGSYDRTVVAADMRAPDAKVPRWGVESDVENVRWNPHDSNYFFVSTESGAVHYYDVRNAPAKPEATKSVWTLQAHDQSVSSFDINPTIPGFMITGSTDRTVKLWNIQESGPSMVVSRNLDVGKVFAATFAPDPEVSFRVAVAGSTGSMHVWDTSTNAGVRKVFAQRLPKQAAGDIVEDKLVGVDDDESESESEPEGEAGAVGEDDDEEDEDSDEDEDDDEMKD